MWIILTILTILFGALSCFFIIKYARLVLKGKNFSADEERLNKLKAEYNSLNNNYCHLLNEYNKTKEMFDQLNDNYQSAQQTFLTLTGQFQDTQIKMGALEEKGRLVRANLDALSGELKAKEERAAALHQLEGRWATLNEEVQVLEGQKGALKEFLAAAEESKRSVKEEEMALRGKVEELTRALEEMMATQREALLRSAEGEGIDGEVIVLSAAEERLVSLLEEVANGWPELREALATVAWKKVWLPHLQLVVKRVLGVKGAEEGRGFIYRLSSMEVEEEGVCYVGQAIRLGERWYNHAKKMIGAVPAGGERLYEKVGRPDQVRWEVIEVAPLEGEGRAKWLNEREEWWIQWYGAREKGWNRK